MPPPILLNSMTVWVVDAGLRQVLAVDVLTGKSKEMMPDTTLRIPPEVEDNSSDRYAPSDKLATCCDGNQQRASMYQVCLTMLLQAHMSLNQTMRWTLSMCLIHVPGCQCTLDMCLVAMPEVLLHMQTCKGKRFVSVNMESPPPQHDCCSCSDSSVVTA